MGVDAESTDLTARIRARRAAGVAAGTIDPSRPGEHRSAGTNPGAELAIDRLTAAAEARERRSGGVEPVGKVYDFEYLPGEEEELALSPEDGGDVVEPEAGAQGEPEPEPEQDAALLEEPEDLSEDELAVLLRERELAEDVLTAPTDAPLRLSVIEEQLVGVERALVLIAQAVGTLPDEKTVAALIVHAVAKVAAAPAQPHVGMIRRFWRWLW